MKTSDRVRYSFKYGMLIGSGIVLTALIPANPEFLIILRFILFTSIFMGGLYIGIKKFKTEMLGGQLKYVEGLYVGTLTGFFSAILPAMYTFIHLTYFSDTLEALDDSPLTIVTKNVGLKIIFGFLVSLILSLVLRTKNQK